MEKARLNFKVVRSTELTDAQWAIIRKFVDTGQKTKKDLRNDCELYSETYMNRYVLNGEILMRNMVHRKASITTAGRLI